MDRLSFLFSLLLIVSVTTVTFGSVIKAKNPNGEKLEDLRSDPDYPEMPRNPKKIKGLLSDAGLNRYPEMVHNRQELEALLKPSHDAQAKWKGEKSSRDEDSEMSKQITVDVLSDLVEREVTITIVNESGCEWKDPSNYSFSGTAHQNLPPPVVEGETVNFEPRKTSGAATGAATGAAGVLAYYIPSIKKTLAVMWSVPFDRISYKDGWNVKLYHGKRTADYNMFSDLYHDAIPFPVDGWHDIDLGSGLSASGSISISGSGGYSPTYRYTYTLFNPKFRVAKNKLVSPKI